MRLAQEPQHSDAGEARTCGLSVSSQAMTADNNCTDVLKQNFLVNGNPCHADIMLLATLYKTQNLMVNRNQGALEWDNHIENVHLGRYTIEYTVRNHSCVSVKLDFQMYLMKHLLNRK